MPPVVPHPTLHFDYDYDGPREPDASEDDRAHEATAVLLWLLLLIAVAATLLICAMSHAS